MKLLLLLLALSQSLAWRILLVTPIGSKSHKIFFMGITEALAKRGHHVTVISSFKFSEEMRNIREIVVNIPDISSTLLSNTFESAHSPLQNLLMKSPYLCSDTLAQKQVQDLKEEQFDLVLLSMFYSDCYFSLVHHFKVPFIYVMSVAPFGPFNSMMNSIDFPSLTPNKILRATFPQTFNERLLTTLQNQFFSLLNYYYVDYHMENICKTRRLCPSDMPSFNEFRDNVSLAVINSVRMLEWPPRPSMPNIIYAGAAHIKPPKVLPKELEDWVADSGEAGFIFFSLGSALKSSLLPEKYRQILVKVFGSLKQKVLWKWDEDFMPGLPKNVKLSKWLPQTDILGHSKLKLFITHGGISSILEATYHGIPIIGMPLFADQFGNMKEAEQEGWARTLPWKELEGNKFRKMIIDTIKDKSLREVAQKRSNLLRDLPIPPDEEAAFWIEYVIRHKGAPHIMSPLRMISWYELYNLDVYVVILGTVLASVYFLWRLLQFLLRTCRHLFIGQEKKKAD